MEKHPVTVLLTKIHCIHSTGESGCDEITLAVSSVKDGVESFVGHYFKDNPLKMRGQDDNDDAPIDVEITGIDPQFVDYLSVNVREQDPDQWADLGTINIYRDDPLEGYKIAYQTTGKAKAKYEISYRIINKPIQTLRVLGVYCEHSTDGCNVDAVERVCEIASAACEDASNVIGKSPRPRAKAVAKGFDYVSQGLDAISNFVKWIGNAAEGDDEVYIQHVDRESHTIQGGGWPQNGGYQKMNHRGTTAPREVMLVNDEGQPSKQYIRVPLDRGPVTMQLREKDPHKVDVSIGSFTFDEAYYNKHKDEGAHIVVADDYFRDQQGGQGALYQICVSVGMEDWAKPPTIEAQGQVS